MIFRLRNDLYIVSAGVLNSTLTQLSIFKSLAPWHYHDAAHNLEAVATMLVMRSDQGVRSRKGESTIRFGETNWCGVYRVGDASQHKELK